MADKTWQQAVNKATTSHATVLEMSRNQMWIMIQMLLGRYGSTPAWAIDQCCDSTQVKEDGTDLFTAVYDGTKFVRAAAGVAHSWWVLAAPAAMGMTCYLTFDYSTGSDYTVALYLSKTRPSGGTLTARPTAADETTVNATMTMNAGAAKQQRCHYWINSEGGFVFAAGAVGDGQPHSGLMCMKLIQLADANDLFPIAAMTTSSASGAFVFSQLNNVQFKGRNTANSAAATFSAITPAINSNYYAYGVIAAGGDASTGYFPDFPVWLFGITGGYTLRGRLPDIAWAPSILADGAVAPIAGDPEFTIVGDLWVPSTEVPVY
jgi:hypothetical protein